MFLLPTALALAVVILTTVPAVDDNSDIGPPVAKVAIGFLSTQIPAVVLPGPDVALVIPATTPSVGPNPVGLDLLLPPWAAGDLQVLAPAVVLLGPDMTLVIPPLLAAVGVLHPCPDRNPKIAAPPPDIVLVGPDMTLVIPPLLAAVGVLHPCPDRNPKIAAPTPDTVLLGPAVVLAIPTTAPSVEDDLAIKYILLPPGATGDLAATLLHRPDLAAAGDLQILAPDAAIGVFHLCPDRDPEIAAPAPDIVFLGPDLTLIIPALLAAIGPLPLCPDGDPKIPAPAPDTILLGPAVVLAIPTTALSVDLEVLPP
ncbi:hypothetical protein Chor_005018 [Crotalus horridus]